MLYLAVSASALVFTIPIFISAEHGATSAGELSYLENFVAAVNSDMAYYAGSSSVFVPTSLCSSAITSDSVIYSNTVLYFDGNVSLDTGALCGDAGNLEKINTTRLQNGTYVVT